MNTADYLAIEGNERIEDVHETLLRQVHPSHMTPEGPSKQAFEPSAAHGFLLSTRREHVGAKAACDDHRAIPLETIGTWGVTVQTATDAETPAIDDELHTGAPAHASLSFLDHATPGARQRSARKLKDAAVCLYQPTADSAN